MAFRKPAELHRRKTVLRRPGETQPQRWLSESPRSFVCSFSLLLLFSSIIILLSSFLSFSASPPTLALTLLSPPSISIFPHIPLLLHPPLLPLSSVIPLSLDLFLSYFPDSSLFSPSFFLSSCVVLFARELGKSKHRLTSAAHTCPT